MSRKHWRSLAVCNETVSLRMWPTKTQIVPNINAEMSVDFVNFVNGKSLFVAIRLPPSPDQGYMKKSYFRHVSITVILIMIGAKAQGPSQAIQFMDCTEMVVGPNPVPLMNILKMATLVELLGIVGTLEAITTSHFGMRANCWSP